MVLKYTDLEEETRFNKIVEDLLEDYYIEIQIRDVTHETEDERLLPIVILAEKGETIFKVIVTEQEAIEELSTEAYAIMTGTEKNAFIKDIKNKCENVEVFELEF